MTFNSFVVVVVNRNVDRLDGCVYTVPDAHTGIVNAIDTVGCVENRGASEILTGGQDGLVKVWDPRCIDAVVQIQPTVSTQNIEIILLLLQEKQSNLNFSPF